MEAGGLRKQFCREWTTRSFMVAAGLCALCFVAFGAGLFNKPVAEDFFPVDWYFTFGPATHFRPVAGLVILFLNQQFGPIWSNALPYHLASLLAHMAATLVVFSLAARLAGSRNLGGAVAVVFAVYPRSHEPVFWHAASVHLLGTLFVLFAIRLYFLAKDRGRTAMLILPALSLLAAFMSNEAMIVGVPLLMLCVFVFETDAKQPPLSRLLHTAKSGIWMIVPLLIFALLVLWSKGGIAGLLRDSMQGNFYRPVLSLSKLQDLMGYLTYAVLPFLPLRTPSTLLRFSAFGVAIAIYLVVFLKGNTLMRFGAAWIVISILPFVVLVQTGNADRYFYLPAFGFAMLAVTLCAEAVKRLSRRWPSFAPHASKLLMGLLALYVVVSLALVQHYNRQWAEAGERVQIMLAGIQSTVKALQPGQKVLFMNIPQEFNGVRFMATGMRSAMRQMFGMPALDVRATVDAALIQQLQAQRGGAGAAHDYRFFEFQDGVVVEWTDVNLTEDLRQRLSFVEQYP